MLGCDKLVSQFLNYVSIWEKGILNVKKKIFKTRLMIKDCTQVE